MKNFMVNYNHDSNGNFFSDALDNFFRPLFYDEKFDSMRTDIKETEDAYVMEVELPGFEKSDISVEYENEYITVRAEKVEKEEDKNDNKNYIRKERRMSCQRSYYVGDIQENAVKASYQNGILSVCVPKEDDKKSQKKGINID